MSHSSSPVSHTYTHLSHNQAHTHKCSPASANSDISRYTGVHPDGDEHLSTYFSIHAVSCTYTRLGACVQTLYIYSTMQIHSVYMFILHRDTHTHRVTCLNPGMSTCILIRRPTDPRRGVRAPHGPRQELPFPTRACSCLGWPQAAASRAHHTCGKPGPVTPTPEPGGELCDRHWR